MLPETIKQTIETLPEVEEIRTVAEGPEAAQEKSILGLQALPKAGLWKALWRTSRNVGTGIAWVTYPVWKPTLFAVDWAARVVGSDARKVLTAHRTSIAHAKGWQTKFKNDLKRWDGWTEEERRSVVRQQSVWGLLLAGVSVLALVVGGWPGYTPMLLLSTLWWMRSHDIKWLNWHWDIVRWGLGLEQVPYESTESIEIPESSEENHG